MPPNIEEIRHQLILLARRRKRGSRVLGWPRDWRPTQVTDPASGTPFTPEGAWEYIADLLEAGAEIETKILDAPEEGKTAYVIIAPLAQRMLYVKLQLGNGCVIGRSFHYSEYGDVGSSNES